MQTNNLTALTDTQLLDTIKSIVTELKRRNNEPRHPNQTTAIEVTEFLSRRTVITDSMYYLKGADLYEAYTQEGGTMNRMTFGKCVSTALSKTTTARYINGRVYRVYKGIRLI